MKHLNKEDWNFLNDKILHKCGRLVIRPGNWYRRKIPLHCSRCNIPMPWLLQDLAEFLYDERSFHDPNTFYTILP